MSLNKDEIKVILKNINELKKVFKNFVVENPQGFEIVCGSDELYAKYFSDYDINIDKTVCKLELIFKV